MNLISFDLFRSLEIPGARAFEPEELFARRLEVAAADWVLFPATWQVPVLAWAWKKRLFPSPESYLFGRDKVEMSRAFLSVCPANVPHTVVVPATPEGAERVLEELPLPLVVKEPRSSMGRGVHLVERRRDLLAMLPGLDVLYAQEHVPSERDLRVVLVGDRVVTAYWRTGGDGFRHNVARGGELDFEGVPPVALELVQRVAGQLGIDHAGFDLIVSGDRLLLLELNVLFGNQGLRARGIRLAPAILEWLERRTPRPSDGQPPLLRAG